MKQLLLILLVSGCLEAALSFWNRSPPFRFASCPNAGPKRDEVKVGAFNVQTLAQKKMAKRDIVKVIVDTIHRYDIILVQEVRNSQTAELLKQAVGKDVYNMVSSAPLGRTSQKELYVFFYRKDVIKMLDSYQYPKGGYQPEDPIIQQQLEAQKLEKPEWFALQNRVGFERPPFSVLFQATALSQSFVLTALHTKPSNGRHRFTFEETRSLDAVLCKVKKELKTDNIILLGDLNFHPDSMRLYEMEKVTIRTDDAKYKWMIPDGMDTTLSNDVKTYDRIIVRGYFLQRAAITNSGCVFKFDSSYGLNKQQAKAVSDHYPVEMKLEEPPTIHDEHRRLLNYLSECVSIH